MTFLEMLFASFLFFLPAGIANMAPVLVKNIPFLATPVDGGKTWKGKPLLGKNKTWRGLVAGIIFGMIGGMLVHWLFQTSSSYPYQGVSPWEIGLFLGTGALIGDLVESFFKRRLKKQPGEKWLGFDQLDWVIGSFVFASLLVGWQWQYLIYGSILYFLLHILTKHLGFWLGIENKKW